LQLREAQFDQYYFEPAPKCHSRRAKVSQLQGDLQHKQHEMEFHQATKKKSVSRLNKWKTNRAELADRLGTTRQVLSNFHTKPFLGGIKQFLKAI
jgi:hypothetical protein